MQATPKSAIDLYIIDQVKKMRNERNISQAVLATYLEVSNAFVGQIEDPRHRSKYNMSHLNKLAKAFDCSPRDFLPENPI